jgi:hypothetical protein
MRKTISIAVFFSFISLSLSAQNNSVTERTLSSDVPTISIEHWYANFTYYSWFGELKYNETSFPYRIHKQTYSVWLGNNANPNNPPDFCTEGEPVYKEAVDSVTGVPILIINFGHTVECTK